MVPAPAGAQSSRPLRSAGRRRPSSSHTNQKEPSGQGLTLVHFSAQRKRFLWNRGCVWLLFRGCLGAVEGGLGSMKGCLEYALCQKRLRLS
jgi:hypothetical protein